MRSHHQREISALGAPAWVASLGRLLALGVILLSTSLCQADEPQETPPTANPQILLLRNGAILRGKILARGEDYLMQAPHGQMVVPGTLVRAACRDLREAFEIMQERAAAQSQGSAYVTLAKWCHSVHLFEEARASLELALNLDANLDEARQLLILNAELKQESRRSQRPRESAETPPAHRRESEPHLGGLPKTLAAQFTTRIQPILTNNCSTASCHGPRSETGFRLERVPVGQRSERGAVERNLLGVSAYLDFQQPSQSPLLSRAKLAHGKPARTLWTGATGRQQLAELQSWVREAAPYLQGSGHDSVESVKNSRGGQTRPEDPLQDPQVILAAAEQELQKEVEPRHESSLTASQADDGPESQPPARLPAQGARNDAAKPGASSPAAHRPAGSRSTAETPPARLKPRRPEPLVGLQKSSGKSTSPANPQNVDPGRDLFDPEEFNRFRKLPSE
jgi:hypothetical protein